MHQRNSWYQKLGTTEKLQIAGILNVTPDSFSDGGLYTDPKKATQKALEMHKQGAQIIDIGAESSRPGSEPISLDEESRRIFPVLKSLLEIRSKKDLKFLISVDTYKPEIASKCLDMGVDIINDITGLKNPEMLKICSVKKPVVVIMHMQGNPKNMQDKPFYKDVVSEIYSFFEERSKQATKNGIEKIILDIGIGFGKTASDNLKLLKNILTFKRLGYPIMVGVSRKSLFKYICEDLTVPTDRDLASVIMQTKLWQEGVDIIRTHNPKLQKDACKVITALSLS